MTSRTVSVDRWFYDVDVSVIEGTSAPPAPVAELVGWLREGKSLEKTHAIALLNEIVLLRRHAAGFCVPPNACATHGMCWTHSEWSE